MRNRLWWRPARGLARYCEVMSNENVEIVRRLWEAADRRDTAAVLALYDPDVELDGTGFPLVAQEGAVYRGHEGLKKLFAEWRETWRDAEARLDEIIDAGDRVISIYTYSAHGRASGTPIKEEFATVSTIASGKVVRVQWFVGREAALKDAGLQE